MVLSPEIRRLMCLLIVTCTASVAGAADVRFEVRFPEALPDKPAPGQVVVFLVGEGSSVWGQEPAEGPFWQDPQPLFGIDVASPAPGHRVTIGPDTAFPNAFPHAPSELKPGRYRAQAIFDNQRLESVWRREAGNLYGGVVEFEVRDNAPVTVSLSLDQVVEPFAFPQRESLREFTIESKLLTDFRRQQWGDERPVKLNAGVVLPIDYDPEKAYAVVYEIPGFSGRHDDAAGYLRRTSGAWGELRRRAFIVVLDPESPNGHTLFCDSRVNGPCGQALVQELIPALEKEFPLVREPRARIVTGHSSGGWSSLWLGLTYPEVFGAVWSTGPDPVDFRRFELVDIYAHQNAYVDEDRQERPAARFPVQRGGYRVTMNVREENGGEGVLGPNNTSGQQWDSWMACWGTPDSNNPAVGRSLFDAQTGAIDHEEARNYEAYDIRLQLSRDPAKYGPIFARNVRLICGEMDNYYLNEAVSLLKAELGKHDLPDSPGYVKLIPNADHGMSLMFSAAMRAVPEEMVRHLDAHAATR